MARKRISSTINEFVVDWLEAEERNNPSEYKNFSDVVEVILKKGIQEHERQKLQQLQIEAGRHGQGEKGPFMPPVQGDTDANLELLPELRRP